ncbi:MAG: SEC-C domain-containing protein, partial [Deltaproteobacteria bacterium]|nr:SEC-C domain-containing protein [Deltaproteobacteria bacterium]
GEGARTSNAVIVRLLNEISDALQRGEAFGPLGQPEPADAPKWARGYVAGARLDARWRNDDMGAALLFPFGVLSGLFTLSPEDMEAAQRERDAEDAKAEEIVAAPATPEKSAPAPDVSVPYYDVIDQATTALYRYWRRHRVRLSGPRRRRVATVHQPCFCGSGAAYSRCCGRARLS